MFADQGATVIVVGSNMLGPHQRGYLNADKSKGEFADLDFNKVDVLIESAAPEPLRPIDIQAPHLVRVQISPLE